MTRTDASTPTPLDQPTPPDDPRPTNLDRPAPPRRPTEAGRLEVDALWTMLRGKTVPLALPPASAPDDD